MSKKKTGLGENPLNWIKKTSEVPKSETSELSKFRTSEVPKFRRYEVKLSILISKEQLLFLEELVKDIMSKRDRLHKKERITKNSIIRSLIDLLREIDFDRENIEDEEELKRRIFERIKR